MAHAIASGKPKEPSDVDHRGKFLENPAKSYFSFP